MFLTNLKSTRLARTLACGLAASAFAAPAASADQYLGMPPDARDAASAAEARDYQDLRSPDARDAASAAEARDYQDLRSPDARDAASAAEARDYQDLRSPDASDATGHYVSDVASENVTADALGSGGFDWSTAGISAAVLSGLLIVSIAGLSGVRHGKRRLARS